MKIIGIRKADFRAKNGEIIKGYAAYVVDNMDPQRGQGQFAEQIYLTNRKQRCTRGYKRYKETSGLIEWKECQIFHSIFT